MTGEQGAAVVLDQVAFAYGGATAIQFDVAFEPSSITALMGPSGSGKSTLLNLVAGFEIPQAGRILIGGEDVTFSAPAARPVSMVFQENNLFGHMTVEANVGLGRSPSLRLSVDDRRLVADALDATGLAGKEKRLPRELSGGERQRVALARVLVRDRPVLLLDEPFASLGPALRVEMLDLLRNLQAERGMSVLMVTHNPEDARLISQKTVLLEDGHIAAVGETADIFAGERSGALERYLGQHPLRSRDVARKPT
jgi:thiamine transport system ATP-binding protein